MDCELKMSHIICSLYLFFDMREKVWKGISLKNTSFGSGQGASQSQKFWNWGSQKTWPDRAKLSIQFFIFHKTLPDPHSESRACFHDFQFVRPCYVSTFLLVLPQWLRSYSSISRSRVQIFTQAKFF